MSREAGKFREQSHKNLIDWNDHSLGKWNSFVFCIVEPLLIESVPIFPNSISP